MDLLPTDEQSEIVQTVRAQLQRDFDLHALAAVDGADRVIDADLWRRCAELGWFGLGLEESLGGVGYTVAEEVLLFAELGAHATPGPFLATVLAARLAASAGHDALAGRLLAGDTHAGLAEPDGDPAAVVGQTVSGRFRTTDADGAEVVLFLTPDAAALAPTAQLVVTPEPSLDRLVPLGSTEVAGAAALCTGDGPDLWRRAGVLVAAELAGIATATAEQSTEYAKDREQFGTPIGAFQAVKHRCADMAVRAEAATSIVRYAALAVADGLPDADFWVHAARAMATDAAITNAHTNVQNHGGIGFTIEHTAHRYVTRAQVRSRTAGDRRHHLDDLLDQPAPA